jgi:hypothetical protein
MKSIIDKNTGKLICATAIEIEILENEMLIDELLTEEMENPYFDFNTRTFYENIS